jgi:hypothetical protein
MRHADDGTDDAGATGEQRMAAPQLLNCQTRLRDLKAMNADPLLSLVKKGERVGVMLRGWSLATDEQRVRALRPPSSEVGLLTNTRLVDVDRVALDEAFADYSILLADRIGVLVRCWKLLAHAKQNESLRRPRPARAAPSKGTP